MTTEPRKDTPAEPTFSYYGLDIRELEERLEMAADPCIEINICPQ